MKTISWNISKRRPGKPGTAPLSRAKVCVSSSAARTRLTAEPLLLGSQRFALLHLLAHLLEHAARYRRIVAELHGELTAPRRVGAEIADVAEHFTERHVRLDTDVGGRRLLPIDHTTAPIEIADHVAHVGLGDEHVHLHDRLEQLG